MNFNGILSPCNRLYNHFTFERVLNTFFVEGRISDETLTTLRHFWVNCLCMCVCVCVRVCVCRNKGRLDGIDDFRVFFILLLNSSRKNDWYRKKGCARLEISGRSKFTDSWDDERRYIGTSISGLRITYIRVRGVVHRGMIDVFLHSVYIYIYITFILNIA